MQSDLRTRLETAAKKAGRSLHAEIIQRLENSFPILDAVEAEADTPEKKLIAQALEGLIKAIENAKAVRWQPSDDSESPEPPKRRRKP